MILEIKPSTLRSFMANKYVSFISDEQFIKCIENLHKAYIKAKNNVTKKQLYANKVDTIKLTFDSGFNSISEEALIETEILRQIDKSINNSIGTFHEQILSGIEGFEGGIAKGYDVKAKDNSLFADIKNKHNTMNSSAAESLFIKLKGFADSHKNAKCYWVQILAKKSFNKPWTGDINGKEYSHSRVYKISGDQFYELITGKNDALLEVYKALPGAIRDYLETYKDDKMVAENSAIDEINAQIEKSKRTILDQITFENYSYYLGFDKL